MRRGLQQQRGLADPRLASDQHERTGDDAATEDAIEFIDAGRHARRDDGIDVFVQLRACRSGERVSIARGRRGRATYGNGRHRLPLAGLPSVTGDTTGLNPSPPTPEDDPLYLLNQ